MQPPPTAPIQILWRTNRWNNNRIFIQSYYKNIISHQHHHSHCTAHSHSHFYPQKISSLHHFHTRSNPFSTSQFKLGSSSSSSSIIPSTLLINKKRSFFSHSSTLLSPAAVGATVRKASAPKVPRKAALTLTPNAIKRLQELQQSPETKKYLKIGTKKKGCSGQAYTLEYVTEISKLDEVITQDGVQVIIDSKALFSLIGSEMDFVEDLLSSQFIFYNPNVKEMCGCGQSFMT